MNDIESGQTTLYITFGLEEEMFAVDVSQVREILDSTRITKIPRAPEFMRGVINVRGSVVPVVDMRLKFGMASAENTANTRIIVLELEQDGNTVVLGALADSVKDVIELEQSQIEDPPRIGSRWRTEFINGIGKRNDEFIILLDIDRIFSSDELAVVDTAASEAEVETIE
jgi:purine-binding chemotaxis protein CheW